MGFVFQRFWRIFSKRVDVMFGRQVGASTLAHLVRVDLFLYISFALVFSVLKIMATFAI